MDGTQPDEQRRRLLAELEMIDDLLDELQPKANASPIGSAARRRYAQLRDRSDLTLRRLHATATPPRLKALP